MLQSKSRALKNKASSGGFYPFFSLTPRKSLGGVGLDDVQNYIFVNICHGSDHYCYIPCVSVDSISAFTQKHKLVFLSLLPFFYLFKILFGRHLLVVICNKWQLRCS